MVWSPVRIPGLPLFTQLSLYHPVTYKKAIECGNQDINTYLYFGHSLYQQEGFAEAAEAFLHVTELEPSNYSYQFLLAQSYYFARLYTQAADAYPKAIGLLPYDFTTADEYSCRISLLNIYKNLNDNENATIMFNFLNERVENHSVRITFYHMACFYSILGNVDEAIINLGKAIEYTESGAKFAQISPDLDNIREDVRYNDLISQVQNSPYYK